MERFDYKEAGPQLLMQAFLQRIVNGGGRVEREYGLGRGRTDLLVIWPVTLPSSPSLSPAPFTPAQRAVIELKVLHKSLEATMAEGLAQTWDYADRCGANEAHLLIFDRRPGRRWEERIWVKPAQQNGLAITVWGL